MFKYNKIKIETTLEEKKVGLRKDYEAKSGVHMYYPFVISSPLPLDKFIYNP
jgi:hypothetical protein